MSRCKKIWSGAFGQDSPNLVHAPGDRRFGDPEDLGRFGVGELLARNEHRRIAERRLHPRNRALQPDRIVEVASIRRGGDADEDGQLLAE